MNDFINRIRSHADHVKRVGERCTTEETTKQALILPLLDILGFNPYDPTKVMAEYAADMPGVKTSERVDYALYCNDHPIMFVEAKSYRQSLDNHAPQLSRYFNCTLGVTIAAITNGREWRFFTDLMNANIMDGIPFLTIDFIHDDPKCFEKLIQFTHDNFEASKLRSFAEESHYTSRFKTAISASIKEVHTDFVRYVAQQAQVSRQLTGRFLESITPMVKSALDQAISELIVKSLTGGTATIAPAAPAQAEPIRKPDFIVDPVNPKIVTTKEELRLLEVLQMLFPEAELYGKDTENYYAVLYKNKSNRWLVRYYVNKKVPTFEFCVPLTNVRRIEIQRSMLSMASGQHICLPDPDQIIRLTSILRDCLHHCQNDENFRRSSAEEEN